MGNNNHVYRILRLPRRYDRACCCIANYNNMENRKKTIMIKGHYRTGAELKQGLQLSKEAFDALIKGV